MEARRIVFLDYMRIVACVIVVIGHKFSGEIASLFENTRNHIAIRNVGEFIHSVTLEGASGVVIFFLVSGYIIANILQKETPLDFFIKRMFRIYPLYIFAVVLDTLVYSQSGTVWPDIYVFIQRLLLIGDIYGTPLGIGGVEWTLRVEVAFYLFMGVLRILRLTGNGTIMTLSMLASSWYIYTSNAIPWVQGFNKAYFSIYCHFILMGVIVFYIEKKMVNIYLGVICFILIFYMHLDMLSIYRPEWKESNYAVIGVAMFIICWASRDKINNGRYVKLFSDITYPMYLFHVMLWPAMMAIVSKMGFAFVNQKLQTVILLIAFCYVANETIERSGIRIGKIISVRLSVSNAKRVKGNPLAFLKSTR
ncbi:acyltransferase family protein [Siccibacter turicensis]|uniref:acyltransferase family protein n=1 Tax=Siccibacter turicensis TaxID=357233 RepID=UPI003F564EF2